MNPNEVRLIDFDMPTLSEVSATVKSRILTLDHYIRTAHPNARLDEARKEIERLQTFHTQILYAFSLVKENERVLNS